MSANVFGSLLYQWYQVRGPGGQSFASAKGELEALDIVPVNADDVI